MRLLLLAFTVQTTSIFSTHRNRVSAGNHVKRSRCCLPPVGEGSPDREGNDRQMGISRPP